MSSNENLEKPPKQLDQPIRLLVALSALCATQHPDHLSVSQQGQWSKSNLDKWIKAVCKLLEIETERLPPSISPEAIKASSEDQIQDWNEEDRSRVAEILVEASLAASKDGKPSTSSKDGSAEGQLQYTPLARASAYKALELLDLEPKELLPQAEKTLSTKLFTAMKAATEAEKTKKDEVESTRASHSQGWGGKFGRHLATGAGVIAGGVLVGVTGGLAAPAIAALLAPLGIGGLLAGGAAPVVLGTLFGIGGGGLAGRRVRERWRGVEEFGFIEVGAGTRATKEEIIDLREARKRVKANKEEEKTEESASAEKTNDVPEKTEAIDEKAVSEKLQSTTIEGDEAEEEVDPNSEETQKMIKKDHNELEEKLLQLSLNTGSRASVSSVLSSGPGTPRTSTDSPRPTLDQGPDEKELGEKAKPPSLTATIIVPGLLVISKTEAITAWRAICSNGSGSMTDQDLDSALGDDTYDGPIINYEPRRRKRSSVSKQGAIGSGTSSPVPASPISGDQARGESVTSPRSESLQSVNEKQEALDPKKATGLRDGRDVYLLRFESGRMLQTGRDIEGFVGAKLKGKLKGQIIKRTALAAYFAAVKLPMSTYKFATMGLDNTWMQAQDRAKKAGRILGEVLEKKVQGERPVVLVGTSLGAFTVMEALLYLASLPTPPGARSAVPVHVESAILISLPSAPTPEEWARCRSVVSRRVVNAWSGSDLVLATVARLHEVVSRATTLSSGMMPAGLGPVEQPAVEDIDVSSILGGHLELQAKIGEIMRVIDIDG